MSLETFTAADTAMLVKDFAGNTAHTWATFMLKPAGNWGCTGLQTTLNRRWDHNNKRKSWERWCRFQDRDCKIMVAEVENAYHPMNGRPELRVIHHFQSAFHKNDPTFAKLLEHEREQEYLNEEDREDETLTDTYPHGFRHRKVWGDSEPIFRAYPEFTGQPGEEEDFSLYDYRSALEQVFTFLSSKHRECVVPGCGRFTSFDDVGGVCDRCLCKVNRDACPCCAMQFGFMVDGVHPFCAHLAAQEQGKKVD